MKEIRVRLDGDQARLGKVPAADVARLLLLLEKAAAQAAAVVLHQPKLTTGRYKGAIEQAVHFRLVGIEEGSVVPVLELPDAGPFAAYPTLEFEVPALGQLAVEALLSEARKPSDPVVAKALLDVADGMHIGDRYDSITFEVFRRGRKPRKTKVDGKGRVRLRSYVDSAPVPEPRADDLVGVLFEADFERRTARLRTPTDLVEVSFAQEHEDAIQAALRQRSTLRGEVAYDPKTNRARSVRLTELVQGIEQLALDPGVFWRNLSIVELAERQGLGGAPDPSDLYDAEATDEERDAFMAAIAELD